MMTCKLIVVPTDMSDYSLRALPYAVGLAQLFGARLDVIYVHEPILLPFGEFGALPPMKPDEQETYVRDEMRKLMLERVPDSLNAVGHVLVGRPADEIMRFAEEHNADLIVIATHGRGGLFHAVMGSTAEKVVRAAPCAVLTLKQPMPVSSASRTRSSSRNLAPV